MRAMSLRGSGLMVVLVACVLGACAKGSEIGDGVGGASGGAGGAPSGSSTHATTAQGSTSGASMTTTSAATTGATTGSTSAATSSSSGTMCGMTEHVCSGMCAGNTIQTGCFGSASCAPCPAAPTHGTENCNASGQCAFSCDTNYVPSGASCVCSLACCADSDCAGGTCVGGQCQSACDSSSCQAGCVFQCALQMKVGIGQCQGANCVCVCL
jgi:hypothetical protein